MARYLACGVSWSITGYLWASKFRETITISELPPLEDTSGVDAAANDASRGRVVYLTSRGSRVAGIVPAELAAVLERVSADELDELAAVAAGAGRTDMAGLLEDLADRAAVLQSRADPGPGIPWEQVKAEAGL